MYAIGCYFMSWTPYYSQQLVNLRVRSARKVLMIRIWMKIADSHSICTYDYDLVRGFQVEILLLSSWPAADASGTRKTSVRVYSLGLAYLTVYWELWYPYFCSQGLIASTASAFRLPRALFDVSWPCSFEPLWLAWPAITQSCRPLARIPLQSACEPHLDRQNWGHALPPSLSVSAPCPRQKRAAP